MNSNKRFSTSFPTSPDQTTHQDQGSVANTRVAGSVGDPGVPSESLSSMASSVTRHAQNPLSDSYELLVCGIDSLDLGLYILWNDKFNDFLFVLDSKKQDAMKAKGILDKNRHGREYIHLPSGKPPNYRYHLQFPEYHLYLSIAQTPQGSPNAYLSVNSEALWKYGLPFVLETLEIDLYHFGGTIERIQPSRVDMCADYRIPGGLSLPFLEGHRVSRAKETTFHLKNDILETYYVGSPSSPIRLRIYDKEKEIHAKGTKYWFADIWKSDDITNVWRVEFQMRRPFLKQFGIDSLEELWQKIGGVWVYLTEEWVSLRLQDNDRTARRSVLPWWETVQKAGNVFNTPSGMRRYGQDDILAPVEWYVSHVGGCLASFAARLKIDDCAEAVKALCDNLEGHWRQKDFKSEVTKRSIRLGRIDCDVEGASHEGA